MLQAQIGASERRATRILFFIGGFAGAAWSSIVPFVKSRAGLDAGTLGLLLLCLGAGSIVSMPLSGALTTRYGCRKVLTIACLVMCATLPVLAIGESVPTLAIALLAFGAGLGCADCAFNIQAIIVENAGDRALM